MYDVVSDGGSFFTESFRMALDSDEPMRARRIDAFEPEAGNDSVAPARLNDIRHLIQTARIDMETESFDDVVAGLRNLPHAANGYVESEILSNHGRRLFTIVMRIPAAQFESVLAQTEQLADVRFSEQRTQDVTDDFYDMTGNLEARQIEEDRLLALIDEAESIHDILALETRLSNTRLSIEAYRSQLETMTSQISYSTINVTLFDVAQEEILITPPTLGYRLNDAFGSSVDGTVALAENVIVFLAGVIIPLTIFGVLVFAFYLMVKLLRKRVRN
jgi:hypothetical protein